MNLDKFLEEQAKARPAERLDEEQLDEGVREFFQGVSQGVGKLLTPLLNPLGNLAKKFVRSVQRVFFKTVKGRSGTHTYPVYEQSAPSGTVYGYMYPDKALQASGKVQGGATKATMLKVFVPDRKIGNAWKVAVDPQFLTNAGRSNQSLNKAKNSRPADLPESSFLGKLNGELDEVRINRKAVQDISSAGQKEKAFSRKMDATYNSTDVGIPGPQEFIDDDALNEYVSSAKIEIENLADILSEFLYTLAWRKSVKQPVPSLLLMGFPGGGKTSLINSFGRGRFQVHVLEIASIYKEILGGFPVIEDVFKDPSLLDDTVAKARGKEQLEGEVEESDDSGSTRTKKVFMKAADLFPQEDGKIHIFFMDEYNRDAEKMAAAMNLMLSGSIGTQYHLPKKTIVIAAGNLGENIDKVKVAKMDSATFDRYDAKVLLSRNVQRSLEYSRASTEYGGEKGVDRDLPDELKLDAVETVDFDKIDEYKIDMGGLNSSIDIFFNTMIEKYGPELMDKGWEKDLSLKPLESEYQSDADYDEEEEMVYQITPRTIDKINTRLKNRALRDWIEAKEGMGDLADPKDIESYFLKNETTSRYMNNKTPEDWEKTWKKHKDEYIGRGIPSPTALYLHVMQWHDAYLPTVLKQTLGGSPKRLINLVRNTAHKAVQEANQVSVEDIVFGYVPKKIWGHELVMKDGEGNERKKTLEREGFMNLVKSMNTMKDQVMRGLVDLIVKNNSDSMLEKKLKAITGKTFDEVKNALAEGGVTVKNVKDVVAFNIHIFMIDTQLTEARAASFIRRLKDFGFAVDNETGTTKEVESEPGADASKKAKEAVAYLYSALWQLSDVIKNTRSLQSGASVDDLDESRLFRGIKVNKDPEAAVLEEGLKNVFKKML
jgi:GTPase SAR1 family protein